MHLLVYVNAGLKSILTCSVDMMEEEDLPMVRLTMLYPWNHPSKAEVEVMGPLIPVDMEEDIVMQRVACWCCERSGRGRGGEGYTLMCRPLLLLLMCCHCFFFYLICRRQKSVYVPSRRVTLHGVKEGKKLPEMRCFFWRRPVEITYVTKRTKEKDVSAA